LSPFFLNKKRRAGERQRISQHLLSQFQGTIASSKPAAPRSRYRRGNSRATVLPLSSRTYGRPGIPRPPSWSMANTVLR